MHVWQWIISGLVAGLLARFAMPQARLGLAADLALGSLGALATGALLRFAGFTQPGPGLVHVVVALIGAIGLIGAIHGFARATAHAGRLVGSAMKPRDLDSRLASLNPEERRVFRKFLSREPVARDLSG